MREFEELADRVLAAHREGADVELSDGEALGILRSGDDALLELVAAAARLRREWFGNRVKVNYLVNLKSGICPEDCNYCSQRLSSETGILKYSWLSAEEAARQAGFGLAAGAARVCLVASGRGPSNRDIERVSTMVEQIKEQNPHAEVCACLGLLREGQAERLKEAGVDAYNHNLNTAESFYGEVCTTHTFQDRLNTVDRAKTAGLSPCSGMIVGMGESDQQILEALRELKAANSDSIPINFLIPFPGTPFADRGNLTPQKCLKILALARFLCPDREIRIAGGREMHLRTLQPLALHIANSIFLGDYLTSEGQAAEADLDMIVDGGFEIVGVEDAWTLREELRARRRAHAHPGGCGSEGACGGVSGCASGESICGSVSDQNVGESTEAQPASAVVSVPAAPTASSQGGTLPCGHTRECAPEPQQTHRTLPLPAIRKRGAGTDAAPNA